MLGKLSVTFLVALTAISGCLESDDDLEANALVADDLVMPLVDNLTFEAQYIANVPETDSGLFLEFVVVDGTTLLNLNATWDCQPMCNLNFHLLNPDGEKVGEGAGMDNVLIDVEAPLAGNWTLHILPNTVAFMVDGVAVLTSSFDVLAVDDSEVEA